MTAALMHQRSRLTLVRLACASDALSATRPSPCVFSPLPPLSIARSDTASFVCESASARAPPVRDIYRKA